jgi:hypothetical protein
MAKCHIRHSNIDFSLFVAKQCNLRESKHGKQFKLPRNSVTKERKHKVKLGNKFKLHNIWEKTERCANFIDFFKIST